MSFLRERKRDFDHIITDLNKNILLSTISDGVTLETFIVDKCKELGLPYTTSKMANNVEAADEPSSKRKRKL